VTLQLFWFFSYFPEPLSITAQSLIARDMRQPVRVQRMAKMLMLMGLLIGVGLALNVVAAYTWLPRLFTNDEVQRPPPPSTICRFIIILLFRSATRHYTVLSNSSQGE